MWAWWSLATHDSMAGTWKTLPQSILHDFSGKNATTSWLTKSYLVVSQCLIKRCRQLHGIAVELGCASRFGLGSGLQKFGICSFELLWVQCDARVPFTLCVRCCGLIVLQNGLFAWRNIQSNAALSVSGIQKSVLAHFKFVILGNITLFVEFGKASWSSIIVFNLFCLVL